MKKQIATFLVMCGGLFAASRGEDLKVIIEKSYLDTQAMPLLSMMATEAIAESQKNINSQELIDTFRKTFTEEATLAKFFAPYQTVFSDEEISELRKIHENPVWKKYSRQGGPIFQSNLQTIKETFQELAANYATEPAEEVVENETADSEEIPENSPLDEIAANGVVQLTQENFHVVQESKKPTIIDINAKWCNPCRMMSPIIEDLSVEFPNIQFAKIDVDAESALADQYDVTGLPTIVFIKAGQTTPSMKSTGYISKEEFEGKIAEFLNQ